MGDCGDTSLERAKARARDQAEAWATLYAETAETVRAREPAEILAGLDGIDDIAALTALVSGASQRALAATTADSFYGQFATLVTILEDIETWQTAIVPERWRPELDGWIAEAIGNAQAGWRTVEAEARKWDPAWTFDDDVLREQRHRRLLPYPQSMLDKRLAQHRAWVRGGVEPSPIAVSAEATVHGAPTGSIAPSREQLVAAVEHHAAMGDPARQAEAHAVVAAYDRLAADSPSGAVDPFAFELTRFRIGWVHAPGIACRDAIVQRLPRLLDLVIEWLDAHASWAANDDRFIGASAAETQRNIERARECNPGFYAVRASQFAETFGPEPWWQRPELAEERAAGRIRATDPRLAQAIDAIRTLDQ